MLLAPYVCYHIFSYVFMVYVTDNLVFSHLGFWSGNPFLIAPFPDRCLLLPSCPLFHLRNAAMASQNVTEIDGTGALLFCALNRTTTRSLFVSRGGLYFVSSSIKR